MFFCFFAAESPVNGDGLVSVGHKSSQPAKLKKVYTSNFTRKEEELFATRFENGFDLKHDLRYNLWVEINHPECSSVPGECS